MSDGGSADLAPSAKDYVDLLVELSVALHKHGMYPAGHPALARLSNGLFHRLVKLFAIREHVAIGVAHRQLIVEGVATDEAHPVLRRLAEALHAHQLGALSFLRGLSMEELSQALRVLAEPAQNAPLGLVPADQRPSWLHVRLHPLAFDNLAIATEGDDDTGGIVTRFEGSDLWLGLAQAALASETLEEIADGGTDDTPETLAAAIERRSGAQAYDQVVAGYLTQIAKALRAATGDEADVLRARTSALIGMLQPGTLRRLIRMSRTESGPYEFVQDAVKGLRVDAVLEVLKATAEVRGETISHGLIRMLTKLASHAEGTASHVREAAQENLREQVARLLADWRLADPNPESYGRLLQQLATSEYEADEVRPPEPELEPPLRLVEMGLEIGALGPLALKAVVEHIDAGGVSDLVGLLDNPPPTAGAAVDALRAQLQSPRALTQLLRQEPVDFAALDALLPSMSAEGSAPLIDALANSENRQTRRRLLDRLAELPQQIGPQILAKLATDKRWHVQRNLLLLLEKRPTLPDDFTPRPWMLHSDWRVRAEAIRIALGLPAERGAAIDAALTDPQGRVITLGLTALAEEPPSSRLDRLTTIVLNADLADDIRLPAMRLLTRNRHPLVVQTLTSLVDGGRTVFGRRKLVAPSAVALAALSALQQHFAADAAVVPFLKAARRSSHDEIRAAVGAS